MHKNVTVWMLTKQPVCLRLCFENLLRKVYFPPADKQQSRDAHGFLKQWVYLAVLVTPVSCSVQSSENRQNPVTRSSGPLPAFHVFSFQVLGQKLECVVFVTTGISKDGN